MSKASLSLLLPLLLFSSLTEAGLLMRASKTATCSFFFENDLFADSDEGYTNGVKASCLSKDVAAYSDINPYADWVDRTIQKIPYLKVGQGKLRKQLTVGASIGQKIYTPSDTSRTDLIVDDRPYAGWLYFSTSVNARDRYHMDTGELVLGIVGPSALGEDAQNGVHDIRDIPEAEGWDNQLSDEIGLMLVVDRRWKTRQHNLGLGMQTDFISHYGGAIGNVYTYVNAGGEIRLGWNIPHDFGTSLIRPGGDVNGPAMGDPRLSGGISVYGFTALTGRYVMRNIFLDGNTFEDSHSVEKKPFVGDIIAGVGVTWDAYKLTFSHVTRSREFDGQKGSHQFGSVNLSISF